MSTSIVNTFPNVNPSFEDLDHENYSPVAFKKTSIFESKICAGVEELAMNCNF